VEKKGIVSVILHKDSTAADGLESFFHALVMANLAEKSRSVHLESQSWMDKQYGVFIQKVHLYLHLPWPNSIMHYTHLEEEQIPKYYPFSQW